MSTYHCDICGVHAHVTVIGNPDDCHDVLVLCDIHLDDHRVKQREARASYLRETSFAMAILNDDGLATLDRIGATA